jgi:hypothetical protein
MRLGGLGTWLAIACLTDRYSRIASWMFVRASASDFPWDQHPGSAGTETLKPSEVLRTVTSYFTEAILTDLKSPKAAAPGGRQAPWVPRR